MVTDDRDLKPSDIQVLSSRDSIAAFFSSLGYNTDDKSGARVKQSASALSISPDTIAKTVKHVERIADQENGTLQVYLFELSSVTVAAIRALARAFRDRAGKYLLVLTSDYENIDFIFLERVLPSAKDGGLAVKGVGVRPHILTVKRRNPETVALRVLRRFTYTESDADAQADKLLSAFGVAEWSERLFNNRALFSDYYLLERLPQTPEWSEQIKSQLLKFRELYSNVREKFSNQKEAVVRERLLQPVFELLGFTAIMGKNSKSMDAEPDYRLYQKDAGTSGKPLAVCLAYTWNRYLDGKDETRDTETPDENPGAHVVTLLEADEASWAIVTNGKVWRLYSSKAHSRATNYYEIDLEENLAMQDPQEAFRFFWLLFRAHAFSPEEKIHKGEKRISTFLDTLIEDSEAYAKELGEKLKSRVFDDIFPHFAEGFIEHMGGADHFLSLSDEERDQGLREVFQGTLTFLYRLLFLLYSESRNLLPVNEVRGYWDLSLSRVKKEIADHAGTIIDEAPEKIKKAYRQDSSELYKQLSKLFGVIDQGDADVNVPLYNGGLFITNPAKDDESPETRNARFLRTNKIPDRYLALGLDMMARGEDNKTHALVAIDYKSLGVRHLGSIYEGLLEFKLRIADEKMAVVKGKKTEEIISYKEAKKNELPIMTIGRGKNAEERVLKKGTVYLENDKRERKATGSYYTPDYIVKYIIENAVGPVLAEKLDALRPKLREAQAAYRQAVKRQEAFLKQGMKGDDPAKTAYTYRHLVDDIFDIKVLDPAMGSGHFLVEAVDFISDKILGDKEGFLRAFPWNPITAELQNTRQTILKEMEKQEVSIDKNRLTDVNLLKRHILKRCIYGVDLNPMAVELAKVSLWLDCFTLGAPLSFLDHHLRSGNSLIGITEKEFEDAQKGQMDLLGGTQFAGAKQAVGAMIEVGSIPDITKEQAQESRVKYGRASAALAPIKRLFDVFTSQWFGNASIKSGKGKAFAEHNYALEFLRDRMSEEWAFHPQKTKLPKPFDSVADIALNKSSEMKFFHWELEFPEIFFGARQGTTQKIEIKDNPGFDAVIGNPPYDVLASEELGYDVSQDISFYEATPVYSPAIRGKKNLYKLFVCRGLDIMGDKGSFSFIVPMALLGDDQSADVRKMLIEKTGLRIIEAFPQKDDPHNRVFAEAKLSTTVFVTSAEQHDSVFVVRTHPGRFIESDSPTLHMTAPLVLAFDPENAAIPSCTQQDWEIASRIISTKHISRMHTIAKSYQGEVNETNEKAKGTLSSDGRKPLALRGANITMYAVREASQGEDMHVDVTKFLKDKGSDAKAFAHKHDRMGFQRSSPQNNFRRIISAHVKKGSYCLDTVSYVTQESSKIDLDLLLVLLNSKILDWYFRLGSTNSKVNEYQFNALPVPTFSDKGLSVDWPSLVKAGQWDKAGDLLCSICTEPGVMSKPVQESLIEMCQQIQRIESARVLKNRSERAHLALESQPIQDAIDKVLFRCYGLSEDDAVYVTKRLEEML